MNQGEDLSTTGTNRLSLLLKVQIIAFLAYGIGWFLVPQFALGTIFGFEEIPDLFHVRTVGAAFLGLTYLEIQIDRKLADRLDLVWGFVIVPALIFVALLLQYNDMKDHMLFFWVSAAVTVFFSVGVGFFRMQINT